MSLAGIKAAVKHRLELAHLRRRRSFGLNGLDHKLASYVTGRGGFFVEAGGNDGMSQSNTAYFERYEGWQGMLIEPIPKLADLCRRNRPKAIVAQCALVPFDHVETTVAMSYCNLMSIVVGAWGSEQADRDHIERGRKFLEAHDTVETIDVPCRPLSDILDEYGVHRVDLLSLDVEGFEGAALRGLDLSRHAPSWILVEANDPAEIDEVLLPRYEFIANLSHHDRLYRLP